MGQDQSYIDMYQTAEREATSAAHFFTLLAENFATYGGKTKAGYYREEPAFTEPNDERNPGLSYWEKLTYTIYWWYMSKGTYYRAQ